MVFDKLKQKLFNRKKATNFEFFASIIGFIAGSLSIVGSLKTSGFLSLAGGGAGESSINLGIFILGLLIIGLTLLLVKRKGKDKFLLVVIILLSLLFFSNLFFGVSDKFFSTIYNPTGELGNIPTTIQECKSMGGVLNLPDFECSRGYLESGNIEDKYICCIPDNCEHWERVYNENTGLFEKICMD